MAQIRNTLNGGIAEVDEELAAELIAAGSWEAADKPVRQRRTKTAPVEEHQDEE